MPITLTFCIYRGNCHSEWTSIFPFTTKSVHSIKLRQTGTWDLGPLLKCLHLDRCLLEQHNDRKKKKKNYKGLKVTACMCSWGKLWTTKHKKTKSSTANFEKPGAKIVHCECILHSAPPKGAKHLNDLSSLSPESASGLTPIRSWLSTPASKWSREILSCFCSLLL